MWVIWPRWTPESRGVRVVQKPSEFRREVRVPALPQHPLFIKGLVSQMDFTVTALGHMLAWRLGAALGCAAQWKPLVESEVHLWTKDNRITSLLSEKSWQCKFKGSKIFSNLPLVVSSRVDSYDSMCPDVEICLSEISTTTQTQWR